MNPNGNMNMSTKDPMAVNHIANPDPMITDDSMDRRIMSDQGMNSNARSVWGDAHPIITLEYDERNR
jgi:hypothetical protein